MFQCLRTACNHFSTDLVLNILASYLMSGSKNLDYRTVFSDNIVVCSMTTHAR